MFIRRFCLFLCFSFLFFDLTVYASPAPITIKILAVNDFHGQISPGRLSKHRPVGSAPVLASYLREAEKRASGRTIFAFIGDQAGASQPSSSLLNDEPTILFLNTLANQYCRTDTRMEAKCNVVATVGNHEFDKGQQAMFDTIYGADRPPTDAWLPLSRYPGANFPYVSANIVDAETKKTLFPPYVIKEVANIRIGFIGAIYKSAATSIMPDHVKGIKFLDPVETINRYIGELKEKGAHIIILLLHQGGFQPSYEGSTQENRKVYGSIIQFVEQLDNSVDVVLAGHTHQFLNAFLKNQHGVKILVTQANSYSSDFAEVTLMIDPKNMSVLKKSARIITTFADQWPGTRLDQKAKELVLKAEEKVNPVVMRHIGSLEHDLKKEANPSGESALGNLVADAFKHYFHTDFAMIGPHGLRNDLYAGEVNWGMLYSVLPFSNAVVKLSLTGEQIYEILEHQWMASYPQIMSVSGLSYRYNMNRPVGKRIVSVYYQDKPLQKDQTYTVATDDFIANTTLKKGELIAKGENDIEVVMNYIKTLPQPFSANIEGRIQRLPTE